MIYTIDFSSKGKGLAEKFWFRIVTDTVWLFVLCALAALYVIRKDATGHFILAVVFLVLYFVFEFYSSFKNEKYLIVSLKADLKSNTFKIVVNKFDKVFLNQEYPLSAIKVELKQLRFGRLFVPSYMLVVRDKEGVIARQRANLIWEKQKIIQMANELSSFTDEKGH